MKDKIRFILTGGTIDSRFNGIIDTIEVLEKTSIPDFMDSMKLEDGLSFDVVCMKDSRQLTQEDLKNITKAIQKSKEKKIIVTHGTYTMTDTAKYLKANLKENNKVIVLKSFVNKFIPCTKYNYNFN